MHALDLVITSRNTSAHYLLEASKSMQENLYGRRSPMQLPHGPDHWELLTNHPNEEIFKTCRLINWTSDDYPADPELHSWFFYHPDFCCIAFRCTGTGRLKHNLTVPYADNMFPALFLARLIFLLEG